MLEKIIEKALALHASDIHLSMHEKVRYRVKESLVEEEALIATEKVFEGIAQKSGLVSFVAPFLEQMQGHRYVETTLFDETHSIYVNEGWPKVYSTQKEQRYSADGAFSAAGLRFRVHLFKAYGTMSAVVRLLYSEDMNLSKDMHRALLEKICALKEGLVLLVGATGSGKSYTLGCCLNYINNHFQKHIIMLEDPIETIFSSRASYFRQRQLGIDIGTMAEGIRDALREDPDIIVIGELRDRETLEAALEAAETGHLVFATLHTQRAFLAVGRMISMVDPSRQSEVRNQLALVLKAVICQRLAFVEQEIFPVRDILLNTSAVANLIRQGKEAQIVSIQETTAMMQTFERAIEVLAESHGHREVFEEVVKDIDELF